MYGTSYWWQEIRSVESRSYICGHCGESISSEKGYWGLEPHTARKIAWIYICHKCEKPTFFEENRKQTPGAIFGRTVKNVTDKEISSLYDEARKSIATSPTATVLACRKLLMHIAVAQGAKEGLSFVDYVQYLADQHLIPPNAKGWVDHIRQKGNEANHEIRIMTRDEAERLINFCGMLLQMLYEFPADVPTAK